MKESLKAFLALIGISSERFERMSQAEQENIQKVSDAQAILEEERNTANAALVDANARISALEADLETSQTASNDLNATLTEAQSSLETANARITELEAQNTELNTRLAALPVESTTTIVTGEEVPPGQQKKKIRSWERDLIK
jgi:chromosome segregation ATPase